ncbi:MAG: hypothetical protein E7265_04020 [Lachnospiraceae bacterium]|nr:hypothetical protein [Lachnospiraceae bacterium]
MKRLMIIGITIIALLCGCGQKTEVPEETYDAEDGGGNAPLFLVGGELISYEDTGDGNCVIKLKVWNHAIRDKDKKQMDIKYAEITTTMEVFKPFSRIDPMRDDTREIMPGDYVMCCPIDWDLSLNGNYPMKVKDNTLYAEIGDMIWWKYAEEVY